MALGRLNAGSGVKVAVVFPGQGSQGVGMGCDVAAHSASAQAVFDRASDALGYDLLALQRNGPEETLRETQFSQPSIFTTNIALYEAAGPELQPVVTAGHSFAELCSLVISNALSFEDAICIVSERGKAMQAAASHARGAMSAVLGLEASQVRGILERRHGGRVTMANFNSPTQIVISGEYDAVQDAGQAMLEAGAKRVIPLNVSGAWHSELMQPALEPLAVAVDASRFSLPSFDVVSNVDGRPYRDVDTIKRSLIRSVVDEVRWHDAAERILSYGPDMVVEFGASGVLSALMKRMSGAPPATVVTDSAGVERLQRALASPAGANV